MQKKSAQMSRQIWADESKGVRHSGAHMWLKDRNKEVSKIDSALQLGSSQLQKQSVALRECLVDCD